MELEEIRTLTIRALQEFNGYDDDDTNMGPEMKQIGILSRRVEELIFTRNPNSPHADTRYSNVTPTVRMNKTEKKYFLESFQDLIRQGVLMWGKEMGDPTSGFYPWFHNNIWEKSARKWRNYTP